MAVRRTSNGRLSLFRDEENREERCLVLFRELAAGSPAPSRPPGLPMGAGFLARPSGGALTGDNAAGPRGCLKREGIPLPLDAPAGRCFSSPLRRGPSRLRSSRGALRCPVTRRADRAPDNVFVIRPCGEVSRRAPFGFT